MSYFIVKQTAQEFFLDPVRCKRALISLEQNSNIKSNLVTLLTAASFVDEVLLRTTGFYKEIFTPAVDIFGTCDHDVFSDEVRSLFFFNSYFEKNLAPTPFDRYIFELNHVAKYVNDKKTIRPYSLEKYLIAFYGIDDGDMPLLSQIVVAPAAPFRLSAVVKPSIQRFLQRIKSPYMDHRITIHEDISVNRGFSFSNFNPFTGELDSHVFLTSLNFSHYDAEIVAVHELEHVLHAADTVAKGIAWDDISTFTREFRAINKEYLTIMEDLEKSPSTRLRALESWTSVNFSSQLELFTSECALFERDISQIDHTYSTMNHYNSKPFLSSVYAVACAKVIGYI